MTPAFDGAQVLFFHGKTVSADPLVLPIGGEIVAEECDFLMFEFQLILCCDHSGFDFITDDCTKSRNQRLGVDDNDRGIEFFQLFPVLFMADLLRTEKDITDGMLFFQRGNIFICNINRICRQNLIKLLMQIIKTGKFIFITALSFSGEIISSATRQANRPLPKHRPATRSLDRKR